MGVSSAVVEDLRQFCQLTHLDISQSVARDSRKVTPASLIEVGRELSNPRKMTERVFHRFQPRFSTQGSHVFYGGDGFRRLSKAERFFSPTKRNTRELCIGWL